MLAYFTQNQEISCLANKSPNHEFACVVLWSAFLYRYFNEVNEIFSSNTVKQLQYVSFKLIPILKKYLPALF